MNTYFSERPKEWKPKPRQVDAETIRQKVIDDHLSAREYKAAEFVICMRWSSYIKKMMETAATHGQRAAFVEANRKGKCANCSVELVYDARLNEHKAKICVPCAIAFADDGLREIDGILGDEDARRMEDNDAFVKLAARYKADAARGACRQKLPKLVQ